MQLSALQFAGATAEPARESNNSLRSQLVGDLIRGREIPVSLSSMMHMVRVERLAQQGRTDAAIDEGLKFINELLHKQAFVDVDHVLGDLDQGLDADVVVALLTATFPARDRLQNRGEAIDRLAANLSADPAEEVRQLIANLRG